MTTRTDPQVLDGLNELMQQAGGRLQRALRAAGLDIGPMEAWALRFFARHPACTQGDVVAATGKDKAQVARLVVVLEERGLVERLPGDAGARVRRVQVTAAGQRLYAAIEQQRGLLGEALLDGFSAAERKAFMAMLARLQANARAGAQ